MANHVYRYIVPPALTILTATGTSINTALKKSLTTNATSVGIAFTCFVEMNEPQRVDVFEDWIRSKAGRKDNELAQLSHAFKGSCLRSLPEFLEECRVGRPLDGLRDPHRPDGRAAVMCGGDLV